MSNLKRYRKHYQPILFSTSVLVHFNYVRFRFATREATAFDSLFLISYIRNRKNVCIVCIGREYCFNVSEKLI